MWESLGTTRRQDRFLHGGAMALNVVIGLIVTPLWLLGQKLTAPLLRLLRRIDSEPPSLPVPEPSEGAMAELMAELEAIPQRLDPKPTAILRQGFADLSSFVLSQQREAANIGYAYPRQFSDHVFEGADGEHIAASVAVHSEPRPGLIVVHGLFSSRRFDYVRRIAVSAYYEWGFNVAAIDLRSFGLTNLPAGGRRAALEEGAAFAPGLPDQPRQLGAAHLARPRGPLGGDRRLPRPAGEGLGPLLRGDPRRALAPLRRRQPHRRGEGAGAGAAPGRRR